MSDSNTKKKKADMDMCNGPILKKLLLFAVPLITTSILQLLYNAADIVIVSRYEGSQALAAVGSTSSLINLIINVFLGLSVGASVIVAKNMGSGNKKAVSETVHTAITLSVILGIIVGLFGFFASGDLLVLMDSPEDVLPLSTLYMEIYFIGAPFSMLYNFGSSILRAIGDTKRPLYILFVSGIVNVLLNMLFVIVFGLGIAGVAIATVISQVISAVCVVYLLIKDKNECYGLRFNELRLHGDKLWQIIKIGFPAGLQGSLFSISNVLIQSSVNSFGSTIMAGNSAASNIEGFVYVTMNAFHQAALTFTGQNYGAGKPERIKKVCIQCMLLALAAGGIFGNLAYIFGEPLIKIYDKAPEVIEAGLIRLSIISTTYCLCGMMDVMVGMLRGLGSSIMPMIVSVVGVCGFRITWIYTVFAADRDIKTLYLSYPISWFVTALIHVVCFIVIFRLRFKNFKTTAQ